MKNLLLATAVALLGLPAFAGPENSYNPTAFAGLTWTLGPDGGQPGVSLKILSTNEPDAVGFAGGVTYNFDGSFGCDAGLAMNSDDVSATLTYDICKGGVQMGLGKVFDEGRPRRR